MEQEMEKGRGPEVKEAAPGQDVNGDQAVDAAQAQRLENQRRARVEIGQFAALFPGVSAEQVPQEVWQEVRDGQTLALAYALYRIKTLEAALERRESSAKLSAGSVSSAGSTALGGTVASFWDAYEV